MDNLTHSLFGAALGQAGLKRLTGMAMPALMIGANIPDVDVVAALFGEGLTGRRGWTHGPVGVLILPALLAGTLIAIDKWQGRRNRRPADRAQVRPGYLLLLCYIGVLTHPLLDLMNTWGIRLLMPFSERWFYGDTLFILDPWIWLLLAGGIWRSHRATRGGTALVTRPAVFALVAVTVYCGWMVVGGRVAESRVAHEFVESGLGHPSQVTAMPVFANPFRREIVVQAGDEYGFGEYRWLPKPALVLDGALVSNGMKDPAVLRASEQEKVMADFLYWSRYPFAATVRTSAGAEITLGDARFGRTPEAGMIGIRKTIPWGDASGPAVRANAPVPTDGAQARYE